MDIAIATVVFFVAAIVVLLDAHFGRSAKRDRLIGEASDERLAKSISEMLRAEAEADAEFKRILRLISRHERSRRLELH